MDTDSSTSDSASSASSTSYSNMCSNTECIYDSTLENCIYM